MAAEQNYEKNYNRRDFLKSLGIGGASLGLFPLLQNPVTAAEQENKAEVPVYMEKYRPQFHFTPMKNWTNDPNGLVYYKGQYHLFFQHNPFGINWGNMTWGHAVSTDLLHWKQLAHAIEPDELGTIFSGSAVVDWNNTSGFQTGEENVLVAFYTAAGKFAKPKKPFTQCIAYSNDRGRTWVKYKNNPVIEHIRAENRDPKVIWYEPTKTWIMALYLDKNDFVLMSSKNLRQWKKLQDITLPGSGECPDFFPLAVDSDPGNVRWVFWGANGRYMLGSFDGQKFTAETEAMSSVVGQYYAAQTYSDIPESDGIQISWMSKGKFPGMPFNQQMSFPCELKLRTFDEGIRLCLTPVKEIEFLRNYGYKRSGIVVNPGDNILPNISGDLFEVQAEIEPVDNAVVGFMIRGVELTYNSREKVLKCGQKDAKLEMVNGRIKLHILIDRTSIEVFANDGRASLFWCSWRLKDESLSFFTRGGSAKVHEINVWQLKSIWS
ncbi:MAG: GH32 C-terminal domain-containing protein [Planctomycetota bacterium]|jgi:sucrose-6-phosphate hydrolase SacC (GH32 family)